MRFETSFPVVDRTMNRRNLLLSATLTAMAGVTPNRAAAQSTLQFETFGVVGDGITDDTAALNRGLAASALQQAHIFGRPGARYRVHPGGEKQFVNPAGAQITKPFCVQVPTGASVDFAGATLEVTEHIDSVVLSNSNTTGNNDVINLRNLSLNGGNFTSTVPVVWFHGCQKSAFLNISMHNTRYIAVLFSALRNSHIHNIAIADSTGQAIQMGGNTAHQISDCIISNLSAINISDFYAQHEPDNPVLIGASRTTIDNIYARNCSGGIKITANSSHIEIGSTYFDGGTTQNCGLKLQGDDNAWCSNIRVNSVVSSNCRGSGLYIKNAAHCFIGSYEGVGNGWGGQDPDVWLEGGDINIGTLQSKSSGGTALLVRQDCGHYAIGSVTIDGAGKTKPEADITVAGGSGSIRNLHAGKISQSPSATLMIENRN